MAPRASWKGFLTIAEVTCPVALYTAASSAERIALHTLNRATGHRVHRQFVDEETGEPVAADGQVKGYEVGDNEFVVLEPSELAAAVPESDKRLTVQAFVRCTEVDDAYFDRPYYLAPADAAALEAYTLIREGLRERQVVALAQSVLFRRVRTVLIRAHDIGLIATTLNFDYEVRRADDAFADVPNVGVKGEMLDLARHIIDAKRGTFDPEAVHDRYEAALAELVRAKMEGKPIPARKPASTGKVIDLMAALRESAAESAPAKQAAKRGKAPAARKPASQPQRRRKAS